jgi:hypothetical protein
VAWTGYSYTGQDCSKNYNNLLKVLIEDLELSHLDGRYAETAINCKFLIKFQVFA